MDGDWRLPHFEKMPHDQATLVDAFLEAWRASQESRYRKAIIDTCSHLIRDMQTPSGGFYSAEDAESYEPELSRQKREGAFYVWSLSQAEKALEETGLLALASAYYGIRENGNASRVGPHLDDKIITAWNGLAISALARAGQILEKGSYVAAARRAAEFLKTNLQARAANYCDSIGARLLTYRHSPRITPFSYNV